MKRLELLEIKILTLVCDGATINRTLFTMLATDKEEPYFMNNPYAADDKRPVLFVCDPCYLVKTLHNNLFASHLPAPGKSYNAYCGKTESI